MSFRPVADVAWDILNRPHHRTKWQAWSRPGARGRGAQAGDEGAQSCIAWVIDDFKMPDVRRTWGMANSSPVARSAVQRFFRQGARPFPDVSPHAPLERITRSRVLLDIVSAFAFTTEEVDEIRHSFAAHAADGTGHMGSSLHTWETARTNDDLRGVIELSRRIIGGRAGFKEPSTDPPLLTDIAPLRSRLDTRADALELCIRHRVGDDHDTLVGYLLAYPLREAATTRILQGEADGADGITDDEIAVTYAEETSLYIGMVLGADLAARASVMERCIYRTTSWVSAHPDAYVFAKRSTDDGERWLDTYGFVPVNDRSGIWLRHPSTPTDRRRRRRVVATVA